MQLSKNFSLEELTRSSTAEIYHIVNAPNQKQIDNLTILCKDVLQPSRNLANIPFIINSGFRSIELNKKVGGKSNSYHLNGCAADIHVNNNEEAYLIAACLLKQKLTDLVLFEKIHNKKWIHVQWSYAPRHKFQIIENG